MYMLITSSCPRPLLQLHLVKIKLRASLYEAVSYFLPLFGLEARAFDFLALNGDDLS
jgi:hypothetical protein